MSGSDGASATPSSPPAPGPEPPRDGSDAPALPERPRFAGPRTPRRSPGVLAVLLALVGAWFIIMRRFGGGIYAVLGPFALAVTLLIVVLFRGQLADWLRPTRRGVLGGLALGAAMTLSTYPLYALGCALVPNLSSQVAVLYAAAHEANLAHALPWLVAIIVAEELLWRGALLEALPQDATPWARVAQSVATYCMAQLGTGSWIVTLLALICGTLWSLQRHWTKSVLSPLIAHLIWTPIVILLLPVGDG